MFAAKKFASNALKSSDKYFAKSQNLVGALINDRSFSTDNGEAGHDPRFLVIVDEEMKSQRETLKNNPLLMKNLQSYSSGFDVDVTGLQKNIIKRLESEEAEWTKPYITQIKKEMNEMLDSSKSKDNQGRGR